MRGRRIPDDWYDSTVPEGVELHEGAYVETSYCFDLYRSALPGGVRMGRGSSAYTGTTFDVGPRGRVAIGENVLLTSVRFICEEAIDVGDHSMLSWNVVLMDCYRAPLDEARRREALRALPSRAERRLGAEGPASPIRIGKNVWIGFDACVLPGVTIGEGAIIGARAVVAADVPAYAVALGNPARVVRRLDAKEGARARR